MDNNQTDRKFFFSCSILEESRQAKCSFLLIATRAARALAADYTRVERERGTAITPRNIFQMLAEDFTGGKADSHFAMEVTESWIRIEPKTQAANWLFNFMDQMQTIESDGKIYKSWPMLLKFVETIEIENGIGEAQTATGDK